MSHGLRRGTGGSEAETTTTFRHNQRERGSPKLTGDSLLYSRVWLRDCRRQDPTHPAGATAGKGKEGRRSALALGLQVLQRADSTGSPLTALALPRHLLGSKWQQVHHGAKSSGQLCSLRNVLSTFIGPVFWG